MVKTAVILAAGINARLNGNIAGMPKGFIEIDHRSLIERSIATLLANRIEKIIIGTGYLFEHYKRLASNYNCIVTHNNDHYRTSGSFFTLYNLKDVIHEDFILLESDLIYENLAIAHLQRRDAKDVILASGRTYSGDEVYIETDANEKLIRMSKNENDLASVFGELVGISRFSIQTYRHVCALLEEKPDILRTIEYEHAFSMLSQTRPIKVDKIENLVWAEIDTPQHLNRVKELVYPKMKHLEAATPHDGASQEHLKRG